MSTPPTHILFLDLETTSSDKDLDILEVAVALVEAKPGLPIVERWSSPIVPRSEPMSPIRSRTVQTMHTKNGLLAEIEAGNAVQLNVADEAIRAIVDRHVPGKAKLPLGGSGVGHFDRQYVDRDLPRVAKRLTYYPIDVGTTRRMIRMVGGELPAPPEKRHRAAECVDHALDEARLYLRLLAGQAA